MNTNILNLTEEELSKLDEKTRKAIEEGRICPVEVELHLSLEDIFSAAFGGMTSSK